MKRAIMLSCALFLGGCGGAHTYSVAAVPVPVYLNSEIPDSVPQLVSVDEDFSSRDHETTSSTSSTSGRTETTTYRWSKENFMANGVYEASKELADEGYQPVFITGEFQMRAVFAAGDTYTTGWFDAHITHEEK